MVTRAIAYGTLLAFVATAIALIAARPDWIGDGNAFLKNFVNHEFLNILGVTLAITLASAAQIHLAFNRIEEHYDDPRALSRSRADLKQNAFALIILFLAAVIVVLIKPIACGEKDTVMQAFFNMAALFILLWHVLLLLSLVQLVFAIPPHFRRRLPAPSGADSTPQPTALTGSQSQQDTR